MKRLSDYLDMLAWSQADLAREARISKSTVTRVLNGKTISRRNAKAIIDAINHATNGKLQVADIRGLRITPIHRSKKKATSTTQEPAQIKRTRPATKPQEG
jgi:transcriptional regulator with XRE-family HTH domain